MVETEVEGTTVAAAAALVESQAVSNPRMQATPKATSSFAETALSTMARPAMTEYPLCKNWIPTGKMMVAAPPARSKPTTCVQSRISPALVRGYVGTEY